MSAEGIEITAAIFGGVGIFFFLVWVFADDIVMHSGTRHIRGFLALLGALVMAFVFIAWIISMRFG